MSKLEKIKHAEVGENLSPCQVNENNVEKVTNFITTWIGEYVQNKPIETLVLGVSGGVDSALVSTLCAKTGLPTILVEMPIGTNNEGDRAKRHIEWLKSNYTNVSSVTVDLTETYNSIRQPLNDINLPTSDEQFEFTMVNTRARLRMTTLYGIAGQTKGIVVGTGNRVEDFGIGFYTKYGDGGVDISPIGDLIKSEVRVLAKHVGINNEILNAQPTDGLHEDGRTDEDQIGATYKELEWAMEYVDDYTYDFNGKVMFDDKEVYLLNEREKEVLAIYMSFNRNNKHKMEPIPVCGLPSNLFN